MSAKFCPLLKERVTYLFCEDCEEQICRGERKKEDVAHGAPEEGNYDKDMDGRRGRQ